jgi:SAM-dependent methyltransferase
VERHRKNHRADLRAALEAAQYVKPLDVQCDRGFHWMSSVVGDAATLSALDERMGRFYGQEGVRAPYEAMLREQDNAPLDGKSVRQQMPIYVCGASPSRVLEIGCASGRLYRQLCRLGYSGQYCGVDVADYVMKENRRRHPEAQWSCARAYKLPFPDAAFDLCFSLYVLEHLVFPERALCEMLRVVAPGGRLVLVFPDFVVAGLLPSQMLGLSPGGSASQKLRQGRAVDALVSLVDSRVRLRCALRSVVRRCGPFPINVRPLCLGYPGLMAPDVDAVYIASKSEIESWAQDRGLAVEYPCGTAGEFSAQAFMVIRR